MFKKKKKKPVRTSRGEFRAVGGPLLWAWWLPWLRVGPSTLPTLPMSIPFLCFRNPSLEFEATVSPMRARFVALHSFISLCGSRSQSSACHKCTMNICYSNKIEMHTNLCWAHKWMWKVSWENNSHSKTPKTSGSLQRGKLKCREPRSR